jgi:hypothetical protein
MRGILIYNGTRPDIALYDGTLLGGLHCGDRFSFYQDGKQQTVRVEFIEDWVIFDEKKTDPLPYGAEVILLD